MRIGRRRIAAVATLSLLSVGSATMTGSDVGEPSRTPFPTAVPTPTPTPTNVATTLPTTPVPTETVPSSTPRSPNPTDPPTSTPTPVLEPTPTLPPVPTQTPVPTLISTPLPTPESTLSPEPRPTLPPTPTTALPPIPTLPEPTGTPSPTLISGPTSTPEPTLPRPDPTPTISPNPTTTSPPEPTSTLPPEPTRTPEPPTTPKPTQTSEPPTTPTPTQTTEPPTTPKPTQTSEPPTTPKPTPTLPSTPEPSTTVPTGSPTPEPSRTSEPTPTPKPSSTPATTVSPETLVPSPPPTTTTPEPRTDPVSPTPPSPSEPPPPTTNAPSTTPKSTSPPTMPPTPSPDLIPDSPSPSTPVSTVPESPSPPTPSTSAKSVSASPVPSPTEEPESPSPPSPGALNNTTTPAVVPETPTPISSETVAQIPKPTDAVSLTTSSPTSSPTSTPKRYERGDDVVVINKKLPNGTKVTVEVVVSPSQTPAVVVRGESQVVGDGSNDSHARAHTILAYFSSLLALVILLLALGLHFVAAGTPSQVLSLSRPNQWEFLAYVTYLQDMASTAHYVVIAVPSYMWKFVDMFSWTSLIPIHGHDSGVGVRFLDDESRRRLSGTVVLDGLVAFGDRIGVGEKQLLETTVAGYVVGIGVLFVLAVVVTYYVKILRDDFFESPHSLRDLSDRESHEIGTRTIGIDRVTKSQRPILIVQGLAVAFFAFSLYPVTVMGIYEISSEMRAQDTESGSLTIALVALIFGCGLFIVYTILSVRKAQRTRKYSYGYRMVWGTLSSPDVVQCDRQLHFVIAWVVMQLATSVVVATVRSETWQLALLLTIDAAAVIGIVFGSPFVHSLLGQIGICVFVLKAINTALAYAFLSGGDQFTPSSRQATASTFVYLNTSVLILWFVRLVWLMYGVVKSHLQFVRKNTATTVAVPSPSLHRSSSSVSLQFQAFPSSVKTTSNL